MSMSNRESKVTNLTFNVMPGDLLFIQYDNPDLIPPVCDLAEGLCDYSGVIKFMENDWNQIAPDVQSQLRGRIGRVFNPPGWISSLDVYSNITLAQRHHTTKEESELRKETELLAATVNLDHIPEGRPEMIGTDVLRKAEWISAFVGQPYLILLEHPEKGVQVNQLQGLANLVRKSLSEDAAVIWVTPENLASWHEKQFQNSKRYIMQNENIKLHG